VSMTPAERTLRARQAAYTMWAREPDPVTRTAPKRRAFMERFDKQVDPDGTLDPETRARMAAQARSAYFADLARRSAKARRLRKAGDGGG